MVEKNTNDVEIKISLTGNDTICRVKLENSLIEDIQKKQGKKVVGVDNIETIIILDRSGSMGDQVQRLYNIIIPGVLYNLGYTADSVVNIVTFDSAIQVLNTKVSKMAAEKIYCRGSTYMAGTIKEIEKLVLGSKKAYFRILAISDGEISDQPATLELASKLADVIKHQYIISAQAVRFFTSSSQPSTKGLSSILQFNTISEANLVDIPQNLENDEIIFQLALLFQDNLGKIDISIKSSNEIFKINPWNVAKKSLNLKSGENIFWLAKQADINGVFNFSYLQNLQLNLAINGSDYPHKIVFENNTNNKLDEFYSELFKDKIDYYFNQIKILKVINNSSSAEEINKIMQYFKGIDDLINATSSESQDLISLNKKLGSRIEYFKQVIKKREKSVYSRLNEIANDDKVSQLNSAQQADYLRNVEVTKNSKSLAKRAINEGINFTDLVRDEVKNMHKHFSEVSSIKDDNHFVSFYSTCTTLDGVKALVETVENGMIDSMDVNDVLKLVNIVGIACDGPIGEYPDPMVWRVSNIFSGTQVSLSDVLVAFESSGGKDLVDIGTKQKITNVVPFFEDEKLMKFFLKYAPNILQYTASVGMRRIIANVPLTFEYTLSSGIWKMVEEVHNSKSDIAIRQLCCMVRSYEIVISNYFAHVMDHFKEQDPKISYFIGNNGITNMISPLIFSIKNDKKGEKFKYYDRILRALYSFEAYQQVRKELKGENYEQNVTKRLNDFLGVDFTKYSTALPELFETIENPVFHDSYTISIEDLNKYKKKLWFLNYALLLPEYIKGVYIDDSKDNQTTDIYNSSDYSKEIKYFKEIPSLNDEQCAKLLGINYSLDEFFYYNLCHAIIYNTKASRVDDVNKKMKFIELDNKATAEAFFKQQTKTIYQNKYSADLLELQKTERSEATKILVKELISVDDMDKFCTLFKDGLVKGKHTVVISDSSKLGFTWLNENLLNVSNECPRRCEKIKVMLTGKYQGLPIFNGGNPMRKTNVENYREIFYKLNETFLWDEMLEEIKNCKLHIYREEPNRQGHSNNFPSYFAQGYLHYSEFYKNLTQDEINEYRSNHLNCCGNGLTRTELKKGIVSDKKQALRDSGNYVKGYYNKGPKVNKKK